MKSALILEGGGGRGAYQVGAYRALLEAGYHFDRIVGASIGALNGCMFVMGAIDKTEELWRSLDTATIFGEEAQPLNDLYEKSKWLEKAQALKDSALLMIREQGISVEPLLSLIRHYVDEEAVRAAPCDFGLTTLNISKKKGMELLIDEIPQGALPEFLLASCYLPIFKSIKICGDYYLDGGFYKGIPLSMAGDDFEELVVIGLHEDFLRYRGVEADPRCLLIRPQEALSGTMYFSPELSRAHIAQGYRDAQEVLKKVRKK